MANNCDYCHKPLSLMRRLRGEQFCSVEHLDAYTAQQAEFALERLAASVNDKPNTARPPLPKPAPRVRPIPTAAPSSETSPQIQPVMAAAVAVQETETVAAPAARAPETEYPMAPYLGQSEIEPRESEAVEDHKFGFEPVEHWGKLSQGWSMPPFRSEPSDPRSWTAGNLVAQIPPVAGWRELLAAKNLDDSTADAWTGDARTEGLLIRQSGTAEQIGCAPKPVLDGMRDAIYGGFALADNRLASADPVTSAPRAKGLQVEWHEMGEPQFSSTQPVQGQIPLPGSRRPELLAAPAQTVTQRPSPAESSQTVGSDTQITPQELDLALPHPGAWNWTEGMEVPTVGMPEFAPVRLGPASVLGAVDWSPVQGTIRGPATTWRSAHLGSGDVSFGWESASAKRLELGTVSGEEAEFLPRLPVPLHLQGQASTALGWAGPALWRNWSTPKLNTVSFEVGPMLTTASDTQWLPLVSLRTERLSPRRRLAPPATAALRPTVKLLEPPVDKPAVRVEIREAGPVKYSPVAIVVMPPPRFALSQAAMVEEQRYTAQVPNGVWRLPRVRHTGYRALGPFPKLPLRVPDRYLQAVAPVMAPAGEEMRLRAAEARQDLSGVPRFAAPAAARIHPADYLVWPQPKGLKLGKMLPERASQPEAAAVPIKRFGPGRAGLQARRRNADGLARA